ncbi:hypothetical protein CAPTEDRAFT_208982 [Capitella teleta]|uniref:AMP-dependent synthetase/ligase domain-containing protein n=1 Tax=Capitella teleta TaxID=283909 RepID=R7TXU5_CAPTE|nr:hypothetical protein CAPTEDRAFT_208982 [Capitella teleta]|eukprot:ELT98559.1 hypothetical protein CAPTEDRAFT_208982 [Capitella teleta]
MAKMSRYITRYAAYQNYDGRAHLNCYYIIPNKKFFFWGKGHNMNEYHTMANVVNSPHKDVPILDQDSFEFMTRRWSQYADRTALVDSGSGDEYTFAELENVIHNVAGHLQSLGFKRGSNLAYCITNCVEIAIVTLATWKLGGVIIPINQLLKQGEASAQLTQTKPDFVFLDEEQYRKLKDAIDDKCVIFIKESIDGILSFATFKEPIQWEPASMMSRDVEADAAIFFSSGTTGLPKAVVLSHVNLVSQFNGWASILETDNLMMKKWTSSVLYLPFSHLYAHLLLNLNYIIGATTIVMPHFDINRFFQVNEQYKCELLILVPPLAVLFAKNKELVAKYDMSKVHTMFCGAAVLLSDVAAELLRVIPIKSNHIAQGYGLTEVSGAATMMPSHSFMKEHGPPDSPMSVGVPIPNVKCAIRDLETKECLPAYGRGELCYAGPGAMKSYLNNMEATDAMIDTEGWLATGDIGYYDSNGYFYIVDRLKELIKYKGYQVSPSEMEDLLLTHPKIADAGVVGFPDVECGELPSAFIVLKPGEDLTVDEIGKFVTEKAAPFKKLRGPIELVAQVPKTGSGKILRRCMLADLQKKHGNEDYVRQ